MKNQTLLAASPAEVKAHQAIMAIKKWMNERYPSLSPTTEARVILECMIELNEEKKFLAAQ